MNDLFNSRPHVPLSRPLMPNTVRPTALGAALALALLTLAGCATQDDRPPPLAMPETPMVQTSTGSGIADNDRLTAGARSDITPRTRDLGPIRARGRTSTSSSPDGTAAGASTAAGRADTGERVELNFVDAELPAVVRALARFTGRNFVVDPRVKGQLTLISEAPVDAVTAYDMLAAALRMQGFAVVDAGGITRVIPEADAKLQGVSVSTGGGPRTTGGLVTRVFQLQFENAANLVPVLRPMIAPNNPVNAYPNNNTLVITDYADNMERIAQVIAGIDTPVSVNADVIPVRHGVASDVAVLVAQMLEGQATGDASQRVTVIADPRSNSVLVRANSPARAQLARDLVMRIDTPQARTGNLHVVYLRNAQATKLAEVLRGALTGQSGGAAGGAGSQGLSGAGGMAGGQAGGLAGSGTSGGLGTGMGMSTRANNTGSAASGDLGGGATSMAGQANSTQPVAFSAGGATVQADPTTNTLLIAAPEPLYRSLREVIDQLDQRRAQVLVESLIVEVTSETAAEFGIQWMTGSSGLNSNSTSFIGGTNFGGSGLNLSSSTATTLDALGGGLNLGVVKGPVNVLGREVLNLGFLATALQREAGTNILSTPNLLTLDNEQASIIVGRTVPFVTGSYVTSSGDGASNPFQTIEREDVGLTLRVRPQISEGGTVKLDIYQEVSSIDEASTSTAGIITRKRALETSVLIDNGQIIVLGGLLEDSGGDSTQSVPLLGDIPWIGSLFRYDRRQRTKTNLMVFLRPHIVRSAQDSQRVSLDRYDYMRRVQDNVRPERRLPLPDMDNPILPELDKGGRPIPGTTREGASAASAAPLDLRPIEATVAPAPFPRQTLPISPTTP